MTKSTLVIREIDDILERFDELDLLCEYHGIRADFILLGGAALLIHMRQSERNFRPTRDIDVNILSTTTDAVKQHLDNLQIDIVGGVMELPPMEDFVTGKRYKLDGGFTSINLYVPSIELLACTKIFSKREKDLKDLEESDIFDLCDRELLRNMIDEYKGYYLNLEDPDLNLHKIMNILY